MCKCGLIVWSLYISLTHIYKAVLRAVKVNSSLSFCDIIIPSFSKELNLLFLSFNDCFVYLLKLSTLINSMFSQFMSSTCFHRISNLVR